MKSQLKTLFLKFVIIAFIPFFKDLSAQELSRYDWQSDRSFQTDLSDNAPLQQLKSHIQYDYEYDYTNNNGDLVCYYTLHKIFKVRNDDAVQSVNRIYIPLNNTLDIVTIKARTLTSDGRKIELDQSNIKEIKDLEDGAGYKIFAIEGAEVNSEIEYFYTKKVSAELFVREYMQFKFPVEETTLKVTSPKSLFFDFRAYNGLIEPNMNIETDELNVTTLNMGKILALPEEGFASYSANRMRIEFKLAKNTARGNKRLFTWADAGKRIFNLIYPFSSTENRAIEKFLKKINIKQFDNDVEKVAYAENYIKSTFYLDNNASSEAENIDQIVNNQFSSNRGMTRLYIALLNSLEIKHEIVLTSSRSVTRFDASFDSWNYLSEYLIFLSDHEIFLAPYSFEYRLGLFAPELSESEGLFIRNINFEGTDTQVSRIKTIPAKSSSDNHDNLDIKILFNKELTQNNVSVSRSHLGYASSMYKSAYLRSDEQTKDEILEEVVKYLAPDAEIQNITSNNLKFDHTNWNDPFIITSNFTTSDYIARAGDIILFKAGMLIGIQSELYQEDTRINDVENIYNRSYKRAIEVEIPEGYEIQNVKDLDMNVEALGKQNSIVYKFFSQHIINGRTLRIEIDEYYDQIYYPKEKFEDFRKVINAAADWNKVTLILQKQ
jgi:hypothetical protein